MQESLQGGLTTFIHALAIVCHFTSLQHHHYRLSEEEAEAAIVQLQFPILICCSL